MVSAAAPVTWPLMPSVGPVLLNSEGEAPHCMPADVEGERAPQVATRLPSVDSESVQAQPRLSLSRKHAGARGGHTRCSSLSSSVGEPELLPARQRPSNIRRLEAAGFSVLDGAEKAAGGEGPTAKIASEFRPVKVESSQGHAIVEPEQSVESTPDALPSSPVASAVEQTRNAGEPAKAQQPTETMMVFEEPEQIKAELQPQGSEQPLEVQSSPESVGVAAEAQVQSVELRDQALQSWPLLPSVGPLLCPAIIGQLSSNSQEASPWEQTEVPCCMVSFTTEYFPANNVQEDLQMKVQPKAQRVSRRHRVASKFRRMFGVRGLNCFRRVRD